MAGRKVGYLFKTENSFDRTKEATRRVLGIDTTNGTGGLNRGLLTVFVKVLSLVESTDDKQAKCVEVVPDATTGEYEAPIGTPWQFDSDNLSNDYTTTNVLSMTALAVDEVIEVEQYIDKSTDFQWLAKKQAVGSALVYIEITDSTNISTYEGTIYDNPITRTEIETQVVVRALQHDAGTLPNSSPGQGLWCIFDTTNEVYHVINYSIFMGT